MEIKLNNHQYRITQENLEKIITNYESEPAHKN